MARPRSEDKESAIMSAAVRVIATHGLGAATATIAKTAGVSNGSLFTYFVTKADLFNAVFVALKTELAAAVADGLSARVGFSSAWDVQKQMRFVFAHWLHWSASYPEKRRALAQLAVSDEITVASRLTARQAMEGIAAFLERCRAKGAMRDAPMVVVLTLVTAVMDAAVDLMISDPTQADQHCALACDAMWHMLM